MEEDESKSAENLLDIGCGGVWNYWNSLFKPILQVKMKTDGTIKIVGLILRVSESEKQQIEAELKRRVAENKPYSLFSNSCSTNVADVLEMIGIMAHDPRYLDTPVSPKELLIFVSRSKRLKRRVDYPKLK